MTAEINPFNGFAAERNIIYIATGLHEVRKQIMSDDVITGKRWVGWSDLKEMLKKGEVTDGQTVAALALAGLHLGHLK